MATYFVHHGGNGSAPTSGDWATAYAGLQAALTAANVNGDVIRVSDQHAENLVAATTFTAAADVAVLCVAHGSPTTLSEMNRTTSYIGTPAATNGFSITLTGVGRYVYFHGMAFTIGGFVTALITLAPGDGCHLVFNKSYLQLSTYEGSKLNVGFSSAMVNGYVSLKDTEVRFGSDNQAIVVLTTLSAEGLILSGTAQSVLFSAASFGGGRIDLNGCDLALAATLLASQSIANCKLTIANSKLKTGVVPLATQALKNKSSGEVFLYNCAAGDVHYGFAHYDALGSTEVSAAIYANDGKTYDGTNQCSWKVVSSADATFYKPYVSPWMDRAFIPAETPVALTPHLEVLRDGSAVAYLDSEIWSDWSYQGTAGFPLASFVTDRGVPLGTPADQAASSKTAADWTGDSGTVWCGKLGPSAAITPLEPGHLRARVCIGAPSTTLYIDPQMRGVA